jgi:hypothetical protein
MIMLIISVSNVTCYKKIFFIKKDQEDSLTPHHRRAHLKIKGVPIHKLESMPVRCSSVVNEVEWRVGASDKGLGEASISSNLMVI